MKVGEGSKNIRLKTSNPVKNKNTNIQLEREWHSYEKEKPFIRTGYKQRYNKKINKSFPTK